MIVAPGTPRILVTSGSKPMNSMLWRVSRTISPAVRSGCAAASPIFCAISSRFARVISRCSMIWICSNGLIGTIDSASSPGICCGSTSMLAWLRYFGGSTKASVTATALSSDATTRKYGSRRRNTAQ